MSAELDLAVMPQEQAVVLFRAPEEVLTEARRAAIALNDIIKNKNKPVKFNGEQYLEFEDWQTLAKFYGLTVNAEWTKFVEFGEVKGFEARAIVINKDGMVVSGAEAMCLNDEPNWSRKPLFQLRSMSQTRACAKALRNVLAWVAVLAGYKPTPAEEMTGMENTQPGYKRPQKTVATPQNTQPTVIDVPHSEDPENNFMQEDPFMDQPSEPQKPVYTKSNFITEPQAKRLFAIMKANGVAKEEVKRFLQDHYGIDSSSKIKKTDYETICNWIEHEAPKEMI